MTPKTVRKTAFIKSIPIMCSYLFVAMAYGMMMQEAGFAWYDSLLASLTIYTGAFQFVLITFLSSGASVLTIAVTALLGCVFLADRLGLTQITKSGYRDLFFSVTVSYVIGAIVYYVSFFQEIRKANRMIREMQYTKQR